MGGVLGNLAYVCSEIWKQIGVAQRLSIALVGLLGIGALATVLVLGTRPNWHVVYADLPPETAARIYELATDAKIPARLTHGGRTVMVPYKHVSALRVQVTRGNIDVAQQGVGLELFDDLKLGLTEMQQTVGLQRAVQGELERMISRIDGIKSARVMLALPERSVFRRDSQQKAVASVFLEMSPGRRLDRAQVQTICRMVAGAVPGLGPEEVTVTDSHGNLLARGPDDAAGMSGVARYLELQEHLEAQIREKAEAALRPILGADSVVAVATVVLDMSAVETTTETYDAERGIVINEKVISEDNTRNDRKKGAAAGTASNMVSVQNPETAGSPADQSTESRKTMENQYAVPKTVRKVTDRSPRIQHLSVAVTIAAQADGTARDKAILDQYKDLVMSSVGAVGSGTSGRTDAVTIIEGRFADRPGEVVQPEATPVEKALGVLSRVSTTEMQRPLLAAFLLFLLYRVFGGMLRRSQLESVDLTTPEGRLAVHALPGKAAGASGLLKEVATEPAVKVRARAAENPAEVAATLEAWMSRDVKFE